MARQPTDLIHGTLDVLVLKILSWRPALGYTIAKEIERRSEGVLAPEDAALYKALHRLEAAGAIAAEWGVSENNRRARYYSLTPAGRKELKAELTTWRAYAAAVNGVLEPA